MIELYNAFIDVVVPAWLNLVNVGSTSSMSQAPVVPPPCSRTT